jgi:preprotein translocase subunit SecG
MLTVILVIHLLIAIALVGTILIQRSEGGALGIGGGGGMGGFMTGRATANLLTRTTAILAAAFMATSLLLAILGSGRIAPQSILDAPTEALPAESTPVEPAAPAQPSEPAAPLAK